MKPSNECDKEGNAMQKMNIKNNGYTLGSLHPPPKTESLALLLIEFDEIMLNSMFWEEQHLGTLDAS